MKGKMVVIAPDETIKVTHYDDAIPIEHIHEAVGGYIELIPHFTKYDGKPCFAFCNEEGKLENLEYNRLASEHWWRQNNTEDYLVGSIAIVQGTKSFMRKV